MSNFHFKACLSNLFGAVDTYSVVLDNNGHTSLNGFPWNVLEHKPQTVFLAHVIFVLLSLMEQALCLFYLRKHYLFLIKYIRWIKHAKITCLFQLSLKKVIFLSSLKQRQQFVKLVHLVDKYRVSPQLPAGNSSCCSAWFILPSTLPHVTDYF